MSSRTSYDSSFGHGKGASRSPSSSSYGTSSPRSSTYTNTASSSRRYGSKPGGSVVIHNDGGATHDPNTSSSAPNSGYYQ